MKKQIKKFVVLALAVGMLATSVLGTSAAFDPVYYAAQNPDVVKALGNSPAMLKLHYDMFGRKEARMSNKNDVEAQLRKLFNADDYAKLFPDVKKAFGNDKEAMFNHYIAFGLLEGRRPSEKVSQETASSLKKTVEKAMKDAGLTAKPGSMEVVAAITGETSNVASAGGAAVQQTIAKVADVVAKEVTATVEEVQNPKPAAAPASKPNAPEVTWVTVTDNASLKSALSAKKKYIKVGNGFNLSERLDVSGDTVLDLNGYTINSASGKAAFDVYANMEVVNSSSKGSIVSTVSNNVVCGNSDVGTEAALHVKKAGATLTLGKDVTIKSTVHVGVRLENGANLTVENGATIEAPEYWAIIVANKVGDATEYKKCTVIIAGSIKSHIGLTVNGIRTVGDKIIVKEGANIDVTGSGLYLAGIVDAEVKGGTIKGERGIEIRNGYLQISGGTIIGKGTFGTNNTPREGGTTTAGVAVGVSQYFSNKAVTVDITGGSLRTEGDAAIPLYVTNKKATTKDGNAENVTVTVNSMARIETNKHWWKADAGNTNNKVVLKIAGITVSDNDVSGNSVPSPN